MAVFEYDTLDLPGTAALDPIKTLKDIGVTLTKADIEDAQADDEDAEAGDEVQNGDVENLDDDV